MAFSLALSYQLSKSCSFCSASVKYRAANLKGFGASVNPRFEGGIPDFREKFNTLHIQITLAESYVEILKPNAYI